MLVEPFEVELEVEPLPVLEVELPLIFEEEPDASGFVPSVVLEVEPELPV